MIYLDNAATTFPKPKCVYDETIACMKKYCGNPGRASHKLSLRSAEKIFETRALLAEFFNAEAENVIFTYNTTYALNIAIKANIKENTHILISDIEHNSVLRPVYELTQSKGCSYDIFSTDGDDDEIISCISSLLKNNTTTLICTHSSNVGAKILPIAKIGRLCKEKGIFFIVDGAQSAGIYNIDIKNMNISALCIPSHKGLYGPQGCGAIIYGDEYIGATVFEGGTGINSLEPTMPDFLPERYEPGTLSTPAIVGLSEGLKWLKSANIDCIRAHEEGLYSLLCDLLSTNEKIVTYKMAEKGGNVLLFNILDKPSAFVSNELDKRDICVRSGFHCSPLAHKKLKTGDSGAVRVGFGVFNTQKDVYTLFDALNDIISSKKI